MGVLPDDAVDLGGETFYTKIFRDNEWIGIHEWHKEKDEWTAGFIAFTGRTQPEWWLPTSPTWEVINEEPLTLSPSLMCQNCGHHGFIRNGRWESC